MSIYDLRERNTGTRKTSGSGAGRLMMMVAGVAVIVALIFAAGMVIRGSSDQSDNGSSMAIAPTTPPDSEGLSVMDANATGRAENQQIAASPTTVPSNTPLPSPTPIADQDTSGESKAPVTAAPPPTTMPNVPPAVAMAPDEQFIPPVSTLNPPDQELASSAFSSVANTDSVRITYAFAVNLALGNERLTLQGNGTVEYISATAVDNFLANYTFNLTQGGGVMVDNLALSGVVSGGDIYMRAGGAANGREVETQWLRFSIADTLETILNDTIGVPGLPALEGNLEDMLDNSGNLDAIGFIESANVARYADAVRLADRDSETAHFNYEVDLVTWLSNELLTLLTTLTTMTGGEMTGDMLEQFLGPMGGGDLNMMMPILIRSIVTELEAEMDAFANIPTRTLSGIDLGIESMFSPLAVNFLLGGGVAAPGPLVMNVDFTANFSNYNDEFVVVEPDEWVEVDIFGEITPDVLATVVP